MSKDEKLWARFIPVFSLVVAVLIPLLQSNGVEVNWWESGIAYVSLTGLSVWSFLTHAVPSSDSRIRKWGAVALALSILSIGSWAALKQWERDHTDNLNLVRVSDVTLREQVANAVYVAQIDIENRGESDIKADFACMIAKPNFPLKPFGIIGSDATKEAQFEDKIFEQVDATEKSVQQQDLPAEKTVYAYCPSSWIPSQDEVTKLEHGDFVLYMVGRIRIPSKREGAHVDVDFCRLGDEKHGLQNCFGHNVPHVHKN